MTVVRTMTPVDIGIISHWLPDVPLMQQYNMTAEKAQRQFEGALARGEWIFVADTAELTACGFAWCLPQGAFGRSPYIRLIAVQPELTSQGTGAALLDAAESRASEVSGDMLLLVSDFNTGAQRFYGRRGYIQIGAIPDFVVPGVSELIFRKKLR